MEYGTWLEGNETGDHESQKSLKQRPGQQLIDEYLAYREKYMGIKVEKAMTDKTNGRDTGEREWTREKHEKTGGLAMVDATERSQNTRVSRAAARSISPHSRVVHQTGKSRAGQSGVP